MKSWKNAHTEMAKNNSSENKSKIIQIAGSKFTA